MKKKTKKRLLFLLKIALIIWLIGICAVYYTTEIVHNLDHLPSSLQKLIEAVYLSKLKLLGFMH